MPRPWRPPQAPPTLHVQGPLSTQNLGRVLGWPRSHSSFVAGHAEDRWRLSHPVVVRQASRSPGQMVRLPTRFCFQSNGMPKSLRSGGLPPAPRTVVSAVAPSRPRTAESPLLVYRRLPLAV